ncbi:MAG TPA: phosphoribosylformylglycinamidine synthase subunit PurL [Acidimicrobiia bacterium]|nr:phosphoribosylformylglycinamidine synthase subunit PurL [Acidimicrobiia bacterium]
MTLSTETTTRELGIAMGLTGAEFDHIMAELGREPNRVELAIFAGMWSEHCSYKSTRELLSALPTTGDRVLAGPGAHAGAVDVGEGWALAFKIESHNHPSAVEPYQGAATGVGGILRDVVAQGARPVAVMDALCFGDPATPRTRWLQDGVVAGIGGYGNSYGVPNVGGVTVYDQRYEGNPLVNALAAGLVRHDRMRTAAATGPGNALLIVGATTGRDGILGAAFASEALGEDHEHAARRSHVQVGDPFMGKKLMEAMLSFEDGLVACQDLGACGIACATSEMAAAGGSGFDVDLAAVPQREAGMEPFEILLSESQERFMLVVERDQVSVALAHFRAHGVHAALCGSVTDSGRMRVHHGGETIVDLPAALVADGTPSQAWERGVLPTPLAYPGFAAPADLGAVLLDLLATPGIADISWLYERYDQTVGNRTVRGPGQGEAAVQRLPHSVAGYAISLVGDGTRCNADPYLGPQSLLGEAVRNLACVGATAVAVSDGINAGSPSNPAEFTRLVETIRGLGDGLRTLGIPVTGGNCSLYNESPTGPIPPTPIIGVVGVIDDIATIPSPVMTSGEVVLLVGTPPREPSPSAYGRLMTGWEGPAPVVDLEGDRRLADFLVAQSATGRIRTAKDAGSGGLAVALAKLAIRSRIGVEVGGDWNDWALFGEGSGMAWATATEEEADSIVEAGEGFGVRIERVGTVAGARFVIAGVIDLSLNELAAAYSGGAM